MSEHRRLGDMLREAGLATDAQVANALERQKVSGRRLGEELIGMKCLTELKLIEVLANQLSIPWVSLYHIEFSRELLNHIPAEVAQKYGLVPVYVRSVRGQGDTLFVAMSDPMNDEGLAAASQASLLPVKQMVAAPQEIRNAIRVYYLGLHPEVEPPPATGILAVEQTDARQTLDAASAPAPVSSTKSVSRPVPRMVSLTLLDGTTVRVPARPGGSDVGQGDGAGLTASDLIAALLARSQGADVSDILPDLGWERLFASLLTLLIRKGLIADWEFVDEYTKRTHG